MPNDPEWRYVNVRRFSTDEDSLDFAAEAVEATSIIGGFKSVSGMSSETGSVEASTAPGLGLGDDLGDTGEDAFTFV
ncbi:MAG: hypothetical protein AAF074_15705 [Pseudomonadota bacterium]